MHETVFTKGKAGELSVHRGEGISMQLTQPDQLGNKWRLVWDRWLYHLTNCSVQTEPRPHFSFWRSVQVSDLHEDSPSDTPEQAHA